MENAVYISYTPYAGPALYQFQPFLIMCIIVII